MRFRRTCLIEREPSQVSRVVQSVARHYAARRGGAFFPESLFPALRRFFGCSFFPFQYRGREAEMLDDHDLLSLTCWKLGLRSDGAAVPDRGLQCTVIHFTSNPRFISVGSLCHLPLRPPRLSYKNLHAGLTSRGTPFSQSTRNHPPGTADANKSSRAGSWLRRRKRRFYL